MVLAIAITVVVIVLVVIAVRWSRRDQRASLATRYFERVDTHATDRATAKAQAERRGMDASEEAHRGAASGGGT